MSKGGFWLLGFYLVYMSALVADGFLTLMEACK